MKNFHIIMTKFGRISITMSEEHKRYLKNMKKNKIIIIITQILLILVILIAWQIAANNNLINTFISSSPKKILETIVTLYKDKILFHHIFTTIYEVLISFIISSSLGLIIAAILWRYNFIYKVLDPYLTILNSMPKVSLGPIIIIISGATSKSIIIMALFISLIITIIDIHHAFIETDQNKIKFLKSLNATKWQIFIKLILPSNLSTIISTCKVNMSLIFVGVITGEFLVSKSGIGYLIMYGSQIFNLNLVMTGIILLAIMATLIYYIIILIEKKLLQK